MKHFFYSVFLVGFCMLFCTAPLQAQKKYASAGEYMTYMSQEFRKITEAYLFYNSEMAHSKKARAVEKSRQELITTATLAKKRVMGMSDWEGNVEFRDAVGDFFRIYEIVLKEDYDQIMDLEDIAEESYDAMEAYMKVKEMASDKLNEADDIVEAAQEKFAKAFEINIIKSEDDNVIKKAKAATEVNKYHQKVYLIFFKAFKQESYLMDAQKKADVSAMEQNQNTLLKVAEEQLKALDTLPEYKGSNALKEACQQYLTFALKEGKEGNFVAFFLEKEKYNEAQKKFKALSKPNKEEVDSYNKAVDTYNNLVNKSNKDNATWNNMRAKAINDWNNASQSFIAKNIPRYNKK